jgi:hypothetical protein
MLKYNFSTQHERYMSKRILNLFLFTLLLNQFLIAQENTAILPAKNAIHGSFGSFILINSAQITYDRLISAKPNGFFKSYYFTAKAGGHASLDFSGSDSGTGVLSSIGITGLTGAGKNHFEVGLGFGYFFDSVTGDDFVDGTDYSDESQFYPQISVGYRKQTSTGFIFRTGLGIIEWAYLGFGYSF